ncbi:MAG TPA: lactonase family protein [Polyangiaceae bacterium]|nr:lactonase family protein [Polyangiaceae bacterium]
MPRRILLAALATCNVLSGCGSDAEGPRGGAGGAGNGGSVSTAGTSTNSGGAGAAALAGTSSVSMAGGGAAGNGATVGGSGVGGSSGGSGTAGGGSGGTPPKQAGTPLVYIGGNGDFPLRAYVLDKSTGSLTQRGGDEAAGKSPSYLAAHPSGPYLYNANEDDGNAAGVSAHHIKSDGTLEPLNHQQGSNKSCNGSCGFTHVAVSPNGKFVAAASYDGGSVSVFPINQDGTLGAEKQMMQFSGGPDPEAHSVAFHPSGNYCWVPTLGLDQVQQLKVSADGTLDSNGPVVATFGKAGPRHMAVHPGGKLAFLINETNSTMVPYTLADGQIAMAGTAVSTLPKDFNGESYGQHVELSPDGHFLYGSNVGHDSIVVFSVDQTSGALTWLQDQPSGGMWPRDFDVDPNGEVVVVANRDSNSLAVFKIGADGKLSALGQPTKVPNEPTAVVIRYQQ